MKYPQNRVLHMLKTAAYTTAACALSFSLLMGSASAAQNIPAASDFLKRAEIIQGDTGTGELRLSDQINRAELMKIVVNAATKQVDPFAFRDCLADISAEWFSKYVCWGVTNKYVAGYPDGAFHAGRPVNRAEALKIISEVFHLNYQQMEPVSDESIWYDKYVKNALRQTILDTPMTADELSQPATRGEVFDYLYRAMAVSSTSLDTFEEGQYASFSTEYFAEKERAMGKRELTAAETALIKTLRAQIDYGFQPLSGTGSTMVKFGGKSFGNMEFATRIDINGSGKLEGTKDAMDAMSQDIQLVMDVKTVSAESISFKATADFSLLLQDEKLYAKLSNLDLVDIEAPIEVRLAMGEMKNQADVFKGQWFSFPIPMDMEEVTLSDNIALSKAMSIVAVDFLEASMKANSTPYFEVMNSEEGNMATLLVTPNADRMNALVENVALEVTPSANRYAMRQMTRTFESAMNMFAKNTTMMISYDIVDSLMRKFSMLIEPVTIELPEERASFTVEAAMEEYYNYDKDFTIEIPADAVDFMDFVNSNLAPEAPVESDEQTETAAE